MGSEVLGIGLAGKSLTDLERRILRETPPYGIVLFGRNIGSAEELCELVREVKSFSSPAPLIMIDEEGGRVDRLRHLIPGLPSAQTFAEGERSEEMSEWFGRIIGMALRYFDIEINLAPVVDIRGGQSPKGLERRTFGEDVKTVVSLAGAFIRGSHGAGVATCLKHFPGIGLGSADPHYGATVIDVPLQELMQRDLVPFTRLGPLAGAIMIGHGTYPQIDEPDLPATLSRRLTLDLLRKTLQFDGAAISDDMEMHAVSDLGSYEEITERALLSGNDVILFCSHVERIPDVDRSLQEKVDRNAAVSERFREAKKRAERYRRHCERLRENSSPPAKSFGVLVEEMEKFCDVFQTTRPAHDTYIPEAERRKNLRHPGKGRSGREEWT